MIHSIEVSVRDNDGKIIRKMIYLNTMYVVNFLTCNDSNDEDPLKYGIMIAMSAIEHVRCWFITEEERDKELNRLINAINGN